jgi:hypothetical protein
MATAPAWQSRLAGLLPHPDQPAVLVLPEGAGWTLPQVVLADRVWFLELGRASRRLSARLGQPVTALRTLAFDTDEERQRVAGIFEVEASQPSAAPSVGGRWVGAAESATLPLAVPADRAHIQTYLAERASGLVPSQRPPWARPGWYPAVLAWIAEQLTRQGYGPVERIEQYRVWGLSCLLRAHTARGYAFFKAAASFPLAAHEARLTAALAERFPAHLPTPIAIDAERHWLLLADFGTPLGREAAVTTLAAAYRAFGDLQVAWAGRGAELLASGCVDRPLERLADQIDPFLAELDDHPGLDATARERLRALGPALVARCRHVAGSVLPPTLVHGDLGPHNMALRDGQVLFFDWAEACVSHPFLDLVEAMAEPDTAVATALREAYLAAWAAWAPPEELREVWRLATPLSALHVAISSHIIQRNLEPVARAPLGWSVPHWVGIVLDTMRP